MIPVDVECHEEFGILYTQHHRLQEVHLEVFLAAGLEATGWAVERQQPFHGFPKLPKWRVPERYIRRPDIYAERGDQRLIVECKWDTPEHGVGQVLLAGQLLERQYGHAARLVLAAPYWCWHGQLIKVCQRIGVEPWPILVLNGYEP